MTKYILRVAISKHGKKVPHYWVNNKMTATASIPADVLPKLEDGIEYDDDPPPPPKKDTWTRICIFCGMGTTWYRMLNSRTIYICQEHYYDKNIGQIAQAVRIKEEGEAHEGEKQTEQRNQETETDTDKVTDQSAAS